MRRDRLAIGDRLVGVSLALCSLAAACSPAIPRVDERLRACASQAAGEPGSADVDLAHGRELYVERCSGCHKLVRPARYPAERWPELVADMASESTPPLTEDERLDMVAYLQAAARCP